MRLATALISLWLVAGVIFCALWARIPRGDK